MNAVRVIELVVAGLFVAGGVRSLVYWSRRSIDSDHLRDQLSFALFRTGRIGLWFAVAGIFLLSASSSLEGRAFAEEFRQHRWYLFVLLILAVMQFVGGYLLGRSVTKRPGGQPADTDPPAAGR